MLHLCTERVRAEGPLASTGGERERYCSADVTRLLRHCRVPKAVHSAQSPAPRGGEGAPEFTFFCFRFIDGDGFNLYPLSPYIRSKSRRAFQKCRTVLANNARRRRPPPADAARRCGSLPARGLRPACPPRRCGEPSKSAKKPKALLPSARVYVYDTSTQTTV